MYKLFYTGGSSCSLTVTNDAMGGDACYGLVKRLEIQYNCMNSTSTTSNQVGQEGINNFAAAFACLKMNKMPLFAF